MTGFENHAGFTISETKLQVVEVNYNGEQYILENVDEAYFYEPLNFIKDKETKISALLQGAFNEISIKKQINCKYISFALPFEIFSSVQIPYDNTLLNKDLTDIFRWELSVLYPFLQTEELVIQYLEIEKNSILDYNTALVISLQRKYLELLNNFSSKNNFKLRFVDNVHIASERALSLSNSLVDKGTILSIYFNNMFLSLIFSQNGKPFNFKLIPVKSVAEIPSVIRKELKEGKESLINKNMINAAFISGENISDSLVQSLRNSLEIDFFNFNPFNKIKPNPNLYENKFYAENFNSFSSSAGIAYRLA